jgi:Putative ATPase subunit of terminase (gpP-like)
MLQEQQAQARELFFQTDLTKTQIADMVGIPRRTLHYWVRQNNWQRIKESAAHMPSILADRCYHIFARFSEQLLSEDRIMRPVTHKEADTLHKLTLTIGKLKNRSTVNESMEMFGVLMDNINRKAPDLAERLVPFIDEYIAQRASIDVSMFRAPDLDDMGLIPHKEADITEQQQDLADIMDWTAPVHTTDAPPAAPEPEPQPAAVGKPAIQHEPPMRMPTKEDSEEYWSQYIDYVERNLYKFVAPKCTSTIEGIRAYQKEHPEEYAKLMDYLSNPDTPPSLAA